MQGNVGRRDLDHRVNARHKVRDVTEVRGRNNEALVERWTRTQTLRGRTALPAGPVPETLAASTDFGNVSHLVPGIHPMVKVSPSDVALHTEDFARWAATDTAVAAARIFMSAK